MRNVKDEKFNKVYEANNSYCTINNLISYSNYEFRIRSIYEGKNSIWSEIKKIKTHLNSNILKDISKQNEYIL